MSVSNKYRLDKELLRRGLVVSRSQAEDIIRRGFVNVAGRNVTKPGLLVSENVQILIKSRVSFVSRAGEKLHSVLDTLQLDFSDKVILDVGSSTGGFTELALRMGAKKVIAVDVGTNQMHSRLRDDPRIELHEKTDIRNVGLQPTEQRAMSKEQRVTSNEQRAASNQQGVMIDVPDIVLIDVSFISLREILPHCSKLIAQNSLVVAMAKPQFEAGDQYKHKGVIKNDSIRRNILKDFENWVQKLFIIVYKADSGVAGAKGNQERFYLLKLSKERL